jgi:tRNA nucleotidyltransferase (CCA-adding enzyme)
MDLSRRDFTVNTFAIALSKSEFGRLIDFFCAWRDLKEKRIRVLHNLSFVEDPTRAFRAIRFEQRLGFKLATHTENLIKTAIKMNFLDKLGGHRLFAELIHIFEEPEPQHAVERMATLGILRFIHRSIAITPEIIHLMHESNLVTAWYELLYLQDKFDKWVVNFLAVCSTLSDEEFTECCARLETGSRFLNIYREGRSSGELALQRIAGRRAMPPSEVCHLLRGLPVEVLLHIMARADENTRRQISAFVTNYSRVKIEVNGNDLRSLGLAPGPVYHELIEQLRDARIDGRVTNREEELQLARDLQSIVVKR